MIYFDNAATSYPKPQSVAKAVWSVLSGAYGNPGRGAHSLSMAAEKKIFECREAISGLFGNEHPENVVLTYNDTYALNFAIKSLAAPNCHIIISCIEHNAVLRPVEALEKIGVRYSIFDADRCDGDIIAQIRSLIRPETRLIIANHRSNICNITLPIEKIGALCAEINASRRNLSYQNGGRIFSSGGATLRYNKSNSKSQTTDENPLFFIVDAAQSAGNTTINTENSHVDVLCAPGHKGLFSPQGIGFALFSERAARLGNKLCTIIEGGSGINSRLRTMPDNLPEHFEAGTLSVPCAAGMTEGIRFVENEGIERIGEYENRLSSRLCEMLGNTAGVRLYQPKYRRNNGAVVLFNCNGIPCETVASLLNERQICVRAGLHCAPLAHRNFGTDSAGAVRVSFSPFNTFTETEMFVKNLKALSL